MLVPLHDPQLTEAFAALVRRWRPVVVERAWLILDDVAEAEDVAQTIFQRLWGSGEWRTLGSPGSYLCRAAWKEALHVQRDRARRSAWLNGVRFDPTYPTPGRAEDPDDLVARGESRARLTRALARLPPQCRRVMKLVLLEGWTQGEVAVELAITQNAVEKQVARGRRHLRNVVAPPRDGRLEWVSSFEDGGGKAVRGSHHVLARARSGSRNWLNVRCSRPHGGVLCEWSAVVDGGSGPTTYAWSGVLSGTTPSVSGTLQQSGWLYLSVTRGAEQQSEQLYVAVDPEGHLPICPT